MWYSCEQCILSLTKKPKIIVKFHLALLVLCMLLKIQFLLEVVWCLLFKLQFIKQVLVIKGIKPRMSWWLDLFHGFNFERISVSGFSGFELVLHIYLNICHTTLCYSYTTLICGLVTQVLCRFLTSCVFFLECNTTRFLSRLQILDSDFRSTVWGWWKLV